MKKLIIILVILSLSSCLTQRRFNNILNKGIEKGWVDTVTKTIDTVFVNKLDTILLTKEVARVVDSIITKTIVKDSCYDKKGEYLGTAFNKKKLEKELKEKILDSLVIPSKIKCLLKPLFIDKEDVLIEVYQDSLGQFGVKAYIKTTTINRPKETSWFRLQASVWYLWLIILILLLLFAIKR